LNLAVTGVPFDQAVTHRPGARFGRVPFEEGVDVAPLIPPYGWDGLDPGEFAIADYGDMPFELCRHRGACREGLSQAFWRKGAAL
jgi:agmatinase